jgi:hypothetical protein
MEVQLPPSSGQTNAKGEDVYVTDEMIDHLISSVVSGESIKKAEARTRELTHEDRCKLRIRAKRDLFFLCYGILGNTRLSPNLHGNLCHHIESTEDKRFREFLLARGNFKSTIVTIGHSIQVVLPVSEEDKTYDGWWFRTRRNAALQVR